MSIKIALIDNDYVVRAKTNLAQNGADDPFRKFIQQIQEELVAGQTAHLEIEDSQNDTISFEITPVG